MNQKYQHHKIKNILEISRASMYVQFVKLKTAAKRSNVQTGKDKKKKREHFKVYLQTDYQDSVTALWCQCVNTC